MFDFMFGEPNTAMVEAVYVIGFIFVFLVLFIGIDDLVWDIYYGLGKLFKKIKKPTIDAGDVDGKIPRKLAIMVAAYNEENVLGPVIRNLILSNQYPGSMYDIFLGVYPNDPGTMRVADELAVEFSNVHKVVHVLEGPSSKADNLNNIIKHIYSYEKEHYLRFNGFIVHDSEDLVHPYEFMLENYLLDEHPAIQIPVFPLLKKPKLGNILKNMVTGTYGDEFAENHYRIMTARSATNAFVPSAGTGFTIRRDLMDTFPDYEVFPVGSLTEDYKLSLQFKEKGYDLYYVLDAVSRMKPDGKIKREFISTRSMFPSNYRSAVRQKTRWIYGITMESFKLREILKLKNLNFVSKYSLYRDWKAKYGNLLLGPGYLIFVYFLISLFVDVPIMYPLFSPSWYLMAALSALMIERQVLRYIAVKNVYGRKSGFISSFLPPILPFRLVLGNIINFNSTILAWKLKLFGPSKGRKKKPRWSKTEHEFLEEEVLKRYRRNLGDSLLYQGIITPQELNRALIEATDTKRKLGLVLIDRGIVPEEEVVRAVCNLRQKIYIDQCPLGTSGKYKKRYGIDRLIRAKALPLFRFSGGLVVMTTIDAEEEKLKEILNEDSLYLIYTTEESLMGCIHGSGNGFLDQKFSEIEDYLLQNVITIEQGLLALMHGDLEIPLVETLNKMGVAVEYDKSIIQSISVLRGDQVDWDVRPQMARLFIREHAPWLGEMVRKEEKYLNALGDIFQLDQFYLAIVGKKILGYAANCKGEELPVNIDSKEFDNVFGLIKDTYAVLRLRRYCRKVYKECPIEKSSLVFYSVIPQLKDRGVAGRIRIHLMSL